MKKKQPATSADPSRTGSVFTVLGCTVDACTRCKSDLEVISKWHIGFLDQVDKLQAGWCLWSPFPQTICLKEYKTAARPCSLESIFWPHLQWCTLFGVCTSIMTSVVGIMQSKVSITPYKNLQTKLTRKSIGQINTQNGKIQRVFDRKGFWSQKS